MNKECKQTGQLLWIQIDSQTQSYKLCEGCVFVCLYFQFMIAMTQTSALPRHHEKQANVVIWIDRVSWFFISLAKSSE